MPENSRLRSCVIVLTPLTGELMIIPTDAARYRIPKTSKHPGVRREPGINRGSSRPEPYAMITCFPEREHRRGWCHSPRPLGPASPVGDDEADAVENVFAGRMYWEEHDSFLCPETRC